MCVHSISGSACDIGAYAFVPAGDPPSNVTNVRRTDHLARILRVLQPATASGMGHVVRILSRAMLGVSRS